MSESKLFDMFVNNLNFNINDFLDEDLTDLQKEIIEEASFIFNDNIVGNISSFGGNIKKNEEKFNELIKQAEEELERDKYKEIKKHLKDYLKKLPEMIIKTCYAVIPVKELPWVEVIFRTLPRIIFDEKVEFVEDAIAYYGFIKCFIGRTTIFGELKGQPPLFAPVTGNLDLGEIKSVDLVNDSKTPSFAYADKIVHALDSPLTQNQLVKYNDQFSRHGDPIADFLMKDEDLINVMSKLTSALKTGRVKSDIAISSIGMPIPSEKMTLVITTDESSDNTKFTNCFEAFLKFSAACCEIPSLPTDSSTSQTSPPSSVRTPGGQELKTWTAEELASEAQKRLTSQPDMPVWSEEELSKFTSERGSGIPEGMELWTEEELQELAEKRRGGGLNIPEWKDEEFPECKKCGYALRPGWDKCPICETPVGEEGQENDSYNVKEETENNVQKENEE